MNFLRRLLGTMPSPETPVELWFVEELSLGDGSFVYNHTLMYSTTLDQVVQNISIPSGNFDINHPIIIARLSRWGKEPFFNTYSKQEFEEVFGQFPLRSPEERSQMLEKILGILRSEIEIEEKMIDILKSF